MWINIVELVSLSILEKKKKKTIKSFELVNNVLSKSLQLVSYDIQGPSKLVTLDVLLQLWLFRTDSRSAILLYGT